MVSRLHYITQDVEGVTHTQLTELACQAGIDWVQLRIKNKSYQEWLKVAWETKQICKKYGAKLIINDNVLITKEIEADGVHLGKYDMNLKEARKILKNNFIIGGSTNTIEDIREMLENGADYIGLGPYRFTSTKESLNPLVGLDGIKSIMSSFEQISKKMIPVIAIGGIKLEDIEPLLQTGIYGIAVSSAINLAEDKILAMKNFSNELRKFAPTN
jgi:thiamine-phosphate pyrophosphorylase